jgi:protein-S-isoprenylcysteine O-methyltransferase Ste14
MRNLLAKSTLLAAQALVFLLTYALPLFLPAGIRAWPAGWTFLVLWIGFWLAILGWLSRQNPGLLQERMRLQTPDQESWDRAAAPLIYISIFVWLLFISYDVTRFHWSPVPTWLQAAGGLVLLSSFYLFFLTFRENSYLSPLVRVQQDRGQVVITTGPYRYVRHPMYSATLVFVGGTPLLLGSWYGILAGAVVALTLAWRTVLEERALLKELPGYREYKAKVKYRLIPYVW